MSSRCVRLLPAGVLLTSVLAVARPGEAASPVVIKVLSNRADLVSGGNALIEVQLPSGVRPSSARIDVDGRNVTGSFAVRANNRFMGLVSGLRNGTNVLTARLPDTIGRTHNDPDGCMRLLAAGHRPAADDPVAGVPGWLGARRIRREAVGRATGVGAAQEIGQRKQRRPGGNGWRFR